MRNLVAFFQRFRIFLVFVLLQVIALSLYFSFLNYPNARFITSAGKVSSYLLEIRHDISKHFNLENANLNLQKENVQLRRKISQSFIPLQAKIYKINDSLYQQNYSYIPATVINSTFDKRNNFLTINAGSIEGIKEGMGVINSKGVVGRIFKVSKHYALVRTLLTEQINIDVLVPNGSFGLLKWDGKNPKLAQISGIPNDIKLKKGDRVVSRGGQKKLPRNYLVGRIYHFEKVNGSPRWKIDLELAVDFRRITEVYVVKNLLEKEQVSLEKKIVDEK